MRGEERTVPRSGIKAMSHVEHNLRFRRAPPPVPLPTHRRGHGMPPASNPRTCTVIGGNRVIGRSRGIVNAQCGMDDWTGGKYELRIAKDENRRGGEAGGRAIGGCRADDPIYGLGRGFCARGGCRRL